MERLILSLLLALSALQGSARAAAPDSTSSLREEPYVAYLAAYMTGTDERHLYYAVAEDGYLFDVINDGHPVLAASFDDQLIRDPHILRCPDGKFRMVATVSWTHRPFTLWESDDLVHWQNERLVDVAPEAATKTWAPEIAYDDEAQQYLIYWTAEVHDDWNTAAIYYVTTRDFETYSEPQMLYREADAGILDANLICIPGNQQIVNGKSVNSKSTWHLIYRHHNQIWEVTSAHAEGPYTDARCIEPQNVEGPFAFPLNDGSGYGIVWDHYGNSAGFGLYTSPDFRTWTAVTNAHAPYYNTRVRFPDKIRHGCILGITAEERDRLKNLKTS